ncbi:MAG: TetR/AcrR family transcriptional regulator [Longimicrobiales bacterium]
MRAAARVFAETGYRGATTRRIAQEADVNEITLFRHFGSKDDLIREAIQYAGVEAELPRLPEEPQSPREELTEWCRAHLTRLYEVRSMIRTCMGESVERPEMTGPGTGRPVRVKAELRNYLVRLQERRMAAPEFDVDVASAMLMGSLFTDAMGRDLMPECYPYGLEEAPAKYVELFLRAIGARASKTHPTSTSSRSRTT